MAAYPSAAITLTEIDANTWRVTIGQLSYTFDVGELNKIMSQNYREAGFLFWMMAMVLQAKNLNPQNSSFSQIKTAIESALFSW